MNNFILRTITGIVFVAILIAAILNHAIFYCIIFSVIVAGSLYEFYNLLESFNGKLNINKLPAIATGVYMFVASYFVLLYHYPKILFLLYLLYLLYIVTRELYKQGDDPINNVAMTLLGHIYIALPFCLFNIFFLFKTNLDFEDPTKLFILPALFPLALFGTIWINDSGAYLVGRALGKHSLFKRISPKKTWEGWLGGALFSLILAGIFYYFFPVFSLLKWMGFAITIVVFGTYGDLWESLIKRSIGVKDSGTILPGHGGLLDRFDSALLAIPAGLLYLFCFI